ncbi:hypothetical protein NXS08_00285 [Gleimia sp. 6138-11-ORH1]|uniref:hypothetical protein n=1 Tax=Gleimia sp. 6138-11-ORH1 TaxID=2973937 RepID=UPI002167DCA8|nr:hypothetical protein [Gleimia sp. 6138-11-ORH1]MCS4483932.1 hypothetical protein [Gleimia sp. 6138-11-ORH1]
MNDFQIIALSVLLIVISIPFAFNALIWWRATYAIGECIRREVSMVSLDYSTLPFRFLIPGYYPVKNSWGFVAAETDKQLSNPQRVRLTSIENLMRTFTVILFFVSGAHFGLTLAFGLAGLVTLDSFWVGLGAAVSVSGMIGICALFFTMRLAFVKEGIEKAKLV